MSHAGAELTPAQRDLVVASMDFAENLSRRVAGTLDLVSVGLTIDDCVQAGYFGLIQAAKRFDIDGHDPKVSTTQTHFRSFAYRRIHGAVIDEWRQLNVRTRGESSAELIEHHHDPRAGADDDWLDLSVALDALSERDRSLAKAMMVGATHAEMSRMFDISEGRVSVIVRDLRARLFEAARAAS